MEGEYEPFHAESFLNDFKAEQMAGNLDAAVDRFCERLISLPPDGRRTFGRDHLRGAMTEFLALAELEYELLPVIDVRGDLTRGPVYLTHRMENRWVSEEGPQSMRMEATLVIEREHDARWRVVVDAWHVGWNGD